MGYINDTTMKQFISPFEFGFSTGTWTPTIATELVSNDRTAADAAFDVMIPIPIPSNSVALEGSKLESVDIWYSIGTAAADDFATAEIVKQTLGADDTANTGAAVTTTEDTPLTRTFLINDSDSPISSLSLSKTSSNASLLPASRISLGGSGTRRTVTLSPMANQYGSTTVTHRSSLSLEGLVDLLLSYHAGGLLDRCRDWPSRYCSWLCRSRRYRGRRLSHWCCRYSLRRARDRSDLRWNFCNCGYLRWRSSF